MSLEATIAGSRPSLTAIIDVVGAHFAVTRKQLLGESQTQQLAGPRHIAMLIASHFGHSASQIGRSLKRDHTSVLHGVKKARERCARDQHLQRTVDLLTRQSGDPASPANRDEVSRDAAEALLTELLETARARGRAAIRRNPAQALTRMALAFAELTGDAA